MFLLRMNRARCGHLVCLVIEEGDMPPPPTPYLVAINLTNPWYICPSCPRLFV